MESFEAVWWWSDPTSQWLTKVIDYIKTLNGYDKDILLMHCENVPGLEKSVSLENYFFNLYLAMNSLKEEQIMFLSIKDLISSIELYLARQRKKDDCVNIDIQDDEILDFYREYTTSYEDEDSADQSIVTFKEFLKKNNCVDINMLHDFYLKCSETDVYKHTNAHSYLILGTPTSPIIKEFIKTLSPGNVSSISMEVPLDISLHDTPNSQVSESVKILHEMINVKDMTVNNESSTFGSATEEYVEDIILSFLSLLINNRNELALSKVMISPVINFSHEAFTALKHLSVEKEMPMCQVAVSYVTRLQLGGKGYAPSSDCPMLLHLKGLELFVDILNQLQMVIEEDASPLSAIKRLISILKKKLLKCGSDKLRSDSIESVAERLQTTLLSISEMLNSIVSTNSVQICQGTLDVLYQFINFISCTSFIYDPEVILSKNKAKRTPLNLPPLLGYFRSPDEESSCNSRLTVNEDSILSTSSVAKDHSVGFASYFHNSESSAASCINSSTPSKTTFKDCLNESTEQSLSENKIKILDVLQENKDVMLPKKNRKRCILSEITNESLLPSDKSELSSKKNPKKTNKMPDKKAKENTSTSSGKKAKKELKKGPKKFKQIQGQGKITSFFGIKHG